MPTTGQLEVICGCMFAGKTTELIRRLAEAQAAGQVVLPIKHASDDRYDVTQLMTHARQGFACRTASDPDEILSVTANAAVVGIDEAHFFGRGLTAVCQTLRQQGKRVIVVGLDNDAWGRPFPPLPALKEAADQVTVLTTPCQTCGRPARFSQRLVPVTDPTMVGGLGEYSPRCREHFESLPAPAPSY